KALWVVPGAPGLCLNSLYHQLQELSRPASQGVNAFGSGGTWHRRSGDVLAAQGQRSAGERDRRQQPIVIDLTEAGSAVLVLGKMAMVLDAKAADFTGALREIGQDGRRFKMEVIHDVAGVIVDLHSLVGHVADDLQRLDPAGGQAAVLFDD